jgi:hypothetical protein
MVLKIQNPMKRKKKMKKRRKRRENIYIWGQGPMLSRGIAAIYIKSPPPVTGEGGNRRSLYAVMPWAAI